MTSTKPKGIDWGAQPLGRVRDTVIAARLGCSPAAVREARRRRRIAAAVSPGGAFRRGTGRGHDPTKRAVSAKRWHDKRRAEGRPQRTPAQVARATMLQRLRRRAKKAMQKTSAVDRLATWGVWSE